MNAITTRDDFERLRNALAARACAGWELHGAGLVSGTGCEGLELLGAPGAVSLRSQEAIRLWRVLRWAEHGGALLIEVMGALGRTRSTLRITRSGRGPLTWGMEWFAEAVASFCARRWGTEAAALRSQGRRVRGSVQLAGGRAAVLGLGPGAAEREVDDALAAGLLARDLIEQRRGVPVDLLLFATPPISRVFAERLLWLRASRRIRLFELGTTGPAGWEEVRPHEQGVLPLVRTTLWPRAHYPADPRVDAILALCPELRQRRRPGDTVERLELRGLECVRLNRGRLSFGVGRRWTSVDGASMAELGAFLLDVQRIRSSNSADREHPFYRLQTERWLASVVAQRVSTLDPALDDRWIYEQVPASRGDSDEYVDMLAVTRQGRLAVIELKAGEDRALPLQGLRYWSRVRWFHERGEISRRGYFPGVELDERPPLLYLVAPLLYLHRAAGLIPAEFAAEVEASLIGVNHGWRSGLRVVRRWLHWMRRGV